MYTKILLNVLLACQVVLCALFLFGDIGFDKAGRYGLDFDAGIIILGIYAIVILVGLILASLKKRWVLVCFQLAPILFSLGYVYFPESKYDAGKYQYLVGKTRVEVQKTIGHPRGFGTGSDNTKGANLDFIEVHGMIIYFSKQDVALYVEKRDW